jgi:hypothetical protein
VRDRGNKARRVDSEITCNDYCNTAANMFVRFLEMLGIHFDDIMRYRPANPHGTIAAAHNHQVAISG